MNGKSRFRSIPTAIEICFSSTSVASPAAKKPSSEKWLEINDQSQPSFILMLYKADFYFFTYALMIF
ncbi:MAG: hypothetical protein AB9903_20250 [Vulcanimicrobiota bacterium]